MVTHDHGTGPGLAAPAQDHQHSVDLISLGNATAHAVVTPTSDSAYLVVGAVEGQRAEDKSAFEQAPADGERCATLKAHLALEGYSLHREAAGDGTARIVATRWVLLRAPPDVAAALAFAEQVGAAHA